MNPISQARQAFAAAAEKAAASTVEQPIARFSPGTRLSRHAHWFVTKDDEVLVAAVAEEEKSTVADEVLAYGLAWQGDRDLHLVLPRHLVAGTVARLPWIQTKVRVWVLEGRNVTPVPPLPRHEVMGRLLELPPRVSKRVTLSDEHQAWIAGVDTADLEAHNRSYLSWHHDGLQVLKASSTREGLRIQAGVQYSNLKSGAQPYDRVFTSAPSPDDLLEINREVREAVGRGGSLTSQMKEHRMQATLASQAADLKLTQLLREYPAYRGLNGSASKRPGRPGYIDFLGIDAQGRFHVVETKIGHDPRVVLQALDYAIWVRANDANLRAQLRREGHRVPDPVGVDRDRLRMHLVLAPGTNGIAFNGYLAPQLEALDGQFDVQVHLVPDADAEPLKVRTLKPGEIWDSGEMIAAPITTPRWPQRLTRTLLGDDE